MRTLAIVLENSPLVQNVYQAILAPFYQVNSTRHIADIDILLDESAYDALIVGENSFVPEAWSGLLVRNPELTTVRKIFVSSQNAAPKGFGLLKRPFSPQELLRLLDLDEHDELAPSADERMLPNSNRRLFERVPLKADVFLNDETGNPIVRLNARDISLGGMFVEGKLPLQVGSMAFLSFKYAGSDVSVTGQVARIGVRGIGVRFLGTPAGITL